MKRQLFRFIPAGALLCFSLYSCKKNDVPTSSTPSQTTTQSLLMQATNTIANAGVEQSDDMSELFGSATMIPADSSECKMVSYNPARNMFPHLTTVDYGSGCTGADSITRSGKKFITVYASWKTAAAGTLLSQTTFSDFWIDSINVSGNISTYLDSAAMPGPLALKVVTSKTFTDMKGNTTTFSETAYWVQTAGDSTTTKSDNVYQITSSSSGSEVLDGATVLTWTSMIDPNHPIIKKGDCYYRSSGIENTVLTLSGGTVFNEVLDYGNGTCDNYATLTINGGTPQQVALPLRFWPLSL